ncbi:hypothetical protein SBRY_30288 [Actinacidiphila bryophytorum]|uniref:Uncharacterized protein n=1 Tax=Actinacidiphila bryophytorum TaxID=1436133 RepID=A0A9W4MB58_9ACTN|nr:hypothetical protein SBRY_30288 [Actinacidiphila bryophytorum]
MHAHRRADTRALRRGPRAGREPGAGGRAGDERAAHRHPAVPHRRQRRGGRDELAGGLPRLGRADDRTDAGAALGPAAAPAGRRAAVRGAAALDGAAARGPSGAAAPGAVPGGDVRGVQRLLDDDLLRPDRGALPLPAVAGRAVRPGGRGRRADRPAGREVGGPRTGPADDGCRLHGRCGRLRCGGGGSAQRAGPGCGGRAAGHGRPDHADPGAARGLPAGRRREGAAQQRLHGDLLRRRRGRVAGRVRRLPPRRLALRGRSGRRPPAAGPGHDLPPPAGRESVTPTRDLPSHLRTVARISGRRSRSRGAVKRRASAASAAP